MKKIDKKELLRKLIYAKKTCDKCGSIYGHDTTTNFFHNFTWDKCDICGQTKNVAPATEFACFITGIRKLKEELKNETV